MIHMKRLFLPIGLITFAIICLSIVHIDNINKLDAEFYELREKHKTKQPSFSTNDMNNNNQSDQIK